MKQNSMINWVKNNKLASFLILVLTIVLLRSTAIIPRPYQVMNDSAIDYGYAPSSGLGTMSVQAPQKSRMESAEYSAGAPAQDRMVVTDTWLSMKVEDVAQTLKDIHQLATENQGFMVSSHLDTPEESASGSISVRVQTSQLSNFLEQVKRLGIRVVSENVSGRDITDQYTNIEERLRLLTSTKTRFEQMLADATQVSDMLEVQRELLNLQTQIDQLEGRKRYLEESADYSLVTVYVATDELALPYVPAQRWSAQVIFRQAVRSLVTTGRGLASLAIWAGVYSPIWLTALGILLVVKKNKRSQVN